MLSLGVNIDHVATLRQARYALMPGARHAEPSVVEAALEAEAAGAHGITAHLRADRRHVKDRDMQELRERISTPLNFELGNAPDIVDLALALPADSACLVPESREEITTEGGLDVVAHRDALKGTIKRFQDAGIRVSLFIDPVPAHIETAGELGAEMIELHTGAFANAITSGERDEEVERLSAAARQAHEAGIQVNAGHGLTTANLPDLFAVPHLVELNIGHHLISRAVTIGLRSAVEEMLGTMERYPGG